jgi:hypothetical protein
MLYQVSLDIPAAAKCKFKRHLMRLIVKICKEFLL